MMKRFVLRAATETHGKANDMNEFAETVKRRSSGVEMIDILAASVLRLPS